MFSFSIILRKINFPYYYFKMLKIFNFQKRSAPAFFHFSFSSEKNPKNAKINRTLYDILEVNSQATQQEIRDSYLKLGKISIFPIKKLINA